MMREGDIVAGRFEVLRLAGTGGMARVFQARDREDGRLVALKVMQTQEADEARRFMREARVLSDLSHPGVVRYIDHGRIGEDCFLAMEWLDGEDLSQRLKRGPLGVDETVALGLRVAEALAVAHARGVVHRDIKPSNLYLPGGDIERVKLLDFGIAALEGATRRLTRTGISMGTPGYMAPEQARGDRVVDPRADIFALGCVLFECLAGRPTFVAGHAMALLGMILFEESPRVRSACPGVPAALDDLVARMLDKTPSGRPSGGEAVAAELAAIPSAGPQSAPVSREATQLTRAEQRIVSVVVTSIGIGAIGSAPTVPSLSMHADSSPIDALREAASRHGARLELLADGSVVAVLPGASGPSEQAARAARCALAMRQALVGAPMVLATGRGSVQSGMPVGEVLDRAALALDDAPTDAVRIDDFTARLIEGRFEMRRGAATDLVAERPMDLGVRRLLGKPSPCVGRDREMGLLTGTWTECATESVCAAVLITGPAGAGKTRLAHELCKALEARGEPVETFVLRGDPLSAGSAFGMLAPAIRRRAGILEGEAPEAAREKLRMLVSRRLGPDQMDRVTKFLGEMISVPYSDAGGGELAAARDDAALMSDQMRAAWQAWLASVCSKRPLLLILEDLHHGDLPTVQAVEAVLRALRDSPLMVLALARPEVHERFPSLWADRNVVEVRLAGLGKRAAERLVRAALGDDPSEVDLAQIIDRAGGNALFLEELSRAWASGSRGALPDTVLGMVQARFDALAPEARRVLRAASVFGHVFWRGGVESLAGSQHGAISADEWLEELERHELVERREGATIPGEVEYAFRDATVREAAYASLTRADCALGHRLAGAWLDEKGARDPLMLAEHFERGGDPKRALGWYVKAANQALDGGDLDAAVARAERAVRCGAEGEALGELRLLEAEALGWRGAFEKAAHQALLATGLLREGSPAYHRAVGELVLASAPLGRHDEVEQAARALLASPPTSRASEPGWVVALCRCANQLALACRHDLARALLAEIDRRAPSLPPNQMVAARVYQARAFVALGSDRIDEALEGHRAAAACFEQAGARRQRLASLTHLSFLYLEVGQLARAEHLLRETLAASERMGIGFQAATARINLGFALARQGRTDDPLATGGHAVALPALLEDRRVDGISRGYLAEVLAQGGDLVGAERQASLAVEMLAPFPALRARALGTMAKVHLLRGRPAIACEAASEGMALLATEGALLLGESLLRLVYARSLEATGEADEARGAIAEARRCLLTRAARLSDPAMRATFLEAVPENAETLALAEAWLGPV